MHPYFGFEQQSRSADGIDCSIGYLQLPGDQTQVNGSSGTNPYCSSWNRNPSEVRMNPGPNGFMHNPNIPSVPHAHTVSSSRQRVGNPPVGWNAGSSIPPTNHSMPVSKNFVQPHIAQFNVGTSGFVSPATMATAGNGTIPQTHTSSQIRVPFSYASSGATYQFPSPSPAYAWSGLCSDTQTMSSLSAVQVTSERRPTLSLLSTDDTGRNSCGTSMLWAQNSLWSTSECSSVKTDSASHTLGTGSWNKGFGKVTKPTFASFARNKLHSKRKVMHKDESGLPHKVFIDEERMSSRLQELNLDNNNLGWHPDLEQQPWFSQGVNNNNNEAYMDDNDLSSSEPEVDDIEDCGRKSLKDKALPTLELSQELKQCVNTKDLLPKAILDELAKPQLQVVLWKPPGDFVKEAVKPERADVNSTMPAHAGESSSSSSGSSGPALNNCGLACDTVDMYTEEEKMASLSLAAPSSFSFFSAGGAPIKGPSTQSEIVDDSMDL